MQGHIHAHKSNVSIKYAPHIYIHIQFHRRHTHAHVHNVHELHAPCEKQQDRHSAESAPLSSHGADSP